MDRRSAARSQENVGGGQRMPMMSRSAPRRPLPARRQSTPIGDEGSEHESEEAERRQPTSIDEKGSEHESAEAERRQSIPTDEESSNHDPAEAEGNSDNESRETSQTRPNSNDQSFARAAQTFETAVRSAWNRFELDRIRRDVTPPAPIVERGSTAIYHAPSILQFYFTNTPPGIHSESHFDHPSNHPAPSISNTQHSPGRDTHNPRKRKRSEGDDEEELESQRPVDTVLPDHPNDNRAPSISNTQPSSGGDTQNPRKRKRSETDDDEEEPERLGLLDTVLAAIEARTLSRADRDILLAALESAEMQGDEEVEGGGERESNDDEMQEEEEVLEDGEGALDDVEMQGNEGVSGDGEGPPNNAEIQSDEGGPGDVEREAYTEESFDGDTIVVTGRTNHQSRIQGETEDVTRGRRLSRTGGRRQRRAGPSDAEEDLYGSSVSPSGRHRPDTRGHRDDQSIADDDANQSEGEEEYELPADDMHETLPRPHGRPTSGSSPQDSQADTRTPSRPNRGIWGSPEKQRAALPSIPEERPMGRPHIPAPHNPEMTSKRKRQDRFDGMQARPSSISPASRDEDLAAMGLETLPTQPDFEEAEEEEGGEGVMEEIPEERTSGDGSEDDDAEGPEENTTQHHPRKIDSHPRVPESKNKKTNAPPKPFKLRLKVTNNPRVADHKKATEEEEVVPSAGSEGNTSPLTSLASGSEEEQPPVKRPMKRQKLRHRGRD
ncbi:hypothetical protein KC318_g1846 [Hortaea werneckii]|nr:hypothetical protein KC334_g603 [Hortaea werneckii]KAI7025711.1 hypothetical protein KC355_g921 [Hortaea werneckii]KAI7674048.1 hypothetical protein KC318_g1846 [Hortaea werneckii]